MAKDYAKSYGKRKRSQKSSSNSGAVWLFVGLLLGLGIAGFIYMNQNGVAVIKNLKVASARLPETKEKTAAHKTTVAAKEEAKQPQFDFYTILPNMNGNESEANIQPQSTAKVEEKAETTVVANKKEAEPNTVKIVSATTDETDNTAKSTVVKAVANKSEEKPESKKAIHKHEVTTEKNETEAVKSSRKTEVAAAETEEPATKKTKHKQENVTADNTETDTHPKKESAKNSRYVLQVASCKNLEEVDQLKAKLAMMGFEVKVKSGQKGHRVYLGAFNSSQQANQVQQQLKEQQVNSTLVKIGDSVG